MRKRHISTPTRPGFTLIEAMLAVMIVGLAISGVMLLMGSGTTANAYGNKLASAVLLADEARALTDGAAFDDLLDFDGTTFTPTDALDNPIASLADYEQALSVTYINPDDFTDYAGTDQILAVHTLR